MNPNIIQTRSLPKNSSKLLKYYADLQKSDLQVHSRNYSNTLPENSVIHSKRNPINDKDNSRDRSNSQNGRTQEYLDYLRHNPASRSKYSKAHSKTIKDVVDHHYKRKSYAGSSVEHYGSHFEINEISNQNYTIEDIPKSQLINIEAGLRKHSTLKQLDNYENNSKFGYNHNESSHERQTNGYKNNQETEMTQYTDKLLKFANDNEKYPKNSMLAQDYTSMDQIQQVHVQFSGKPKGERFQVGHLMC